MPQCTGPELAQVIRMHDDWMHVPIVYVSGAAAGADQLLATRNAGEAFVPKPVDPRELVATVRANGRHARQIAEAVSRDGLTGVLKRSFIQEYLVATLERAQRSGSTTSVAMIDIDHFKSVNDTHGHPVGDLVIRTLAAALRQRLRASDGLGRVGGEEFLAVLPDCNAEEAKLLLGAALQRFREIAYDSPTGDFHCSFSAGIAESRGGALSDAQLVGWRTRRCTRPSAAAATASTARGPASGRRLLPQHRNGLRLAVAHQRAQLRLDLQVMRGLERRDRRAHLAVGHLQFVALFAFDRQRFQGEFMRLRVGQRLRIEFPRVGADVVEAAPVEAAERLLVLGVDRPEFRQLLGRERELLFHEGLLDGPGLRFLGQQCLERLAFPFAWDGAAACANAAGGASAIASAIASPAAPPSWIHRHVHDLVAVHRFGVIGRAALVVLHAVLHDDGAATRRQCVVIGTTAAAVMPAIAPIVTPAAIGCRSPSRRRSRRRSSRPRRRC
jgi:diguanylate cyclase (GGDEF)-like protein